MRDERWVDDESWIPAPPAPDPPVPVDPVAAEHYWQRRRFAGQVYDAGSALARFFLAQRRASASARDA